MWVCHEPAVKDPSQAWLGKHVHVFEQMWWPVSAEELCISAVELLKVNWVLEAFMPA